MTAAGLTDASQVATRSPRSSSASPRLGIFLAFFGFFLLTGSRERPWADATPIYEVAERLVDDGHVDVSVRWPSEAPPGRDGKSFALNPLLTSLVHVPGAALRRVVLALGPGTAAVDLSLPWACHLAPAALGALVCVLFFALCRRHGVAFGVASVATVIVGAGSVVWVYARSPFSEILQTACFTGLLYEVVRALARPDLRAGARLGFWAGALLNSKLVFAAALPGPLLLLAWRHRRDGRALVRFFAGAALAFIPAVALFLYYDWLRFGSVFDAGYNYSLGKMMARGSTGVGLWGLSLSPGKSIFLYTPALLLTFPALRLTARAHRDTLLAIAGAALPVVISSAGFAAWHGDWSWGPRYLTFVVPALLLPVACWLEALRRAGRRRALALALGLSLAAGGFVSLLGTAFYWDHFVRIAMEAHHRWLGQPDRGGAITPDLGGLCDGCYEDLHMLHWLPQFQPIRGHLWLLRHVPFGHDWVRAEVDAPWHPDTTLRVDIASSYGRARVDWWPLDYGGHARAAAVLLVLTSAIALVGIRIWLRALRRDDARGTLPSSGEEVFAAPLVGPEKTAAIAPATVARKWPTLLLVLTLYGGALWVGRADIPLTDDAGFYLGAAQAYKAWCEEAWRTVRDGGGNAFRPEVIDRYFVENWVHPPLAKLALASGIAVFHDGLGWLDEIEAARTATMALSTALAGLVFLLCWRTYGPAVAVAAPLCLLVMPRFFFDSHLENLDVASAATYFLAVYCYWRARRSGAWAVAAGAAAGIAMATKINGALVALPLAVHWLLVDRPWAKTETGWRRIRPPQALILMVTLGPAVAVAVWPWLWTHTLPRLADYLRFYLVHHPSLFYYRGTIYDVPFAPWHAPFVMAAITTPLPILFLALAGAAVALVRGRAADPFPPSHAEARRLDALVLLNAAFTIGVVALPSVPKYGGVKLFLPFFPFLAILAAIGLEALVRTAADSVRMGRHGRQVLWAAALGALVVPMAWTMARRHPYHLSYYNALVGGLRGAERHGFEIQYYDLWYLDLARFLDRTYPGGVRVFFEPNNKEYLRHVDWYYRAGRLSPKVVIVSDESQADLVVLTHEMRWPEYPSLRARLRGGRVVHELRVDGVALLTVYEVRSPA